MLTSVYARERLALGPGADEEGEDCQPERGQALRLRTQHLRTASWVMETALRKSRPGAAEEPSKERNAHGRGAFR